MWWFFSIPSSFFLLPIKLAISESTRDTSCELTRNGGILPIRNSHHHRIAVPRSTHCTSSVWYDLGCSQWLLSRWTQHILMAIKSSQFFDSSSASSLDSSSFSSSQYGFYYIMRFLLFEHHEQHIVVTTTTIPQI